MSNYGNVVRARLPLHYWRLGENAGTTVFEEMVPMNGTYTGSPSLFQTGPTAVNDGNKCVHFDANVAGPSANLGHSALWAVPNNATLLFELWFNVPSAPGVTDYLFGKNYDQSALNSEFFCQLFPGAGVPAFLFYISDGVNQISSGSFTSTYANWHYLVIIKTLKKVDVYLDNLLIKTGNNASFGAVQNFTAHSPYHTLRLSKNAAFTPTGPNVKIDELAVYDYDWYSGLLHKDWYNYLGKPFDLFPIV
jgi:hypothetical protein